MSGWAEDGEACNRKAEAEEDVEEQHCSSWWAWVLEKY